MIQVDVLLFPVLWLALAPFALRYVTARDGAHFNRRYDGLNNHTIQAEKNNSNSDSNNPKVKVEPINRLGIGTWASFYTDRRLPCIYRVDIGIPSDKKWRAQTILFILLEKNSEPEFKRC